MSLFPFQPAGTGQGATLNLKLNRFREALPDPELLPTARLNKILSGLIREGEVGQVSCGSVQGLEELRSQVSRRAFGYGCELSPDELVVTAGCTEALCLCLQAVCRPGDLVAIESPTYFGILLALEAQHLRALEIPSHPRKGMSLEALSFAVENHPVRAVVAMTNYSNPTGSFMSETDKEALVGLLARKEIPLIEDDINGELTFAQVRPGVAKAWDRKGLVLLCSSFSKDISTGFRIGWTAPGRYYDEVKKLKYAFNIRTSPLPQLAMARFLESGGYEHLLRRIRKTYGDRVSALSRAVGEHFPEGTRITEPAGGFVLWVQLPCRIDSMLLYREALRAFITLAPGYIFSPAHKFDDCIRLSASSWTARSGRDIARLGAIASSLCSQAMAPKPIRLV